MGTELHEELLVHLEAGAEELSVWQPAASYKDAKSTDSREGNEAQGLHGDQHVKEIAYRCLQCQIWLNGPTRWQDHLIGKKHQKKRRACLSAEVAAVVAGSGV